MSATPVRAPRRLAPASAGVVLLFMVLALPPVALLATGLVDLGALFGDPTWRASLAQSLRIAFCVALFSTVFGLANACLLRAAPGRAKTALSVLVMLPLFIPGDILGIGLLAFASRLAQFADDRFNWQIDLLRPGAVLAMLGQLAPIVSVSSAILGICLRRLGPGLEDAAIDLGASRAGAFWSITLPRLRSALWGSALVAALLSLAEVNATQLLAGSHPPMSVWMSTRLRESLHPLPAAAGVWHLLVVAAASMALLRLAGEASWSAPNHRPALSGE